MAKGDSKLGAGLQLGGSAIRDFGGAFGNQEDSNMVSPDYIKQLIATIWPSQQSEPSLSNRVGLPPYVMNMDRTNPGVGNRGQTGYSMQPYRGLFSQGMR